MKHCGFAWVVVVSGCVAIGPVAHAEPPPDIAPKLANIGRVIDPVATGALYAPQLKAQSYEGVRVTRDVSYGPDDKQRLDVFVPAATQASPRAVLIFVHGGGYVRGDKHAPDSPFYDNVMLWAANHGMIGINVNYRLAPQNGWPSGAEDLGLATRWVQQNIAAQGGAPARIFLVGHSSGASHVAGYVAQPRFHGPQGVGLAGVALISPGIIDPTRAKGPTRDAYFGEDASVYAERSSLPGILIAPLPVMVTVAEFDPPEIEGYATQLRGALCDARRCPTWTRFAGHNHMSVVDSFNTADDEVGAALLAFMQVGR
ncbi:hypothetical protein PPGU19_077260 (plasmid) [Paraburkholderia sp. PGU19]|uniref:alpha/beta hydrolase n=1 Tax=Paraburkholderia sp. PGU19 TaxID=2735434 RepID=UPI0015DB510F|nr:alpha/beta hydrolase [Paraburkholderia sp. PGU19]BCG03158.1 hypothetical protein PPGU19_077260 [Paraburkholderia sp. PGU19]